MNSDDSKNEINNVFSSGSTPSQAYAEYSWQLNLILKMILSFICDRLSHKCPRRRDFNALYLKYCHDKLGRRNGAEMFETLEERIDKFKKSNEGAKIT